jgi:3-isopropylmalate/(R)-2-methylmalate dehydratase large subunit
MAHTLYDMIWRDHLVDEQPDGTCLLYVDRHILHEVDGPQAFDGIRRAGLRVRAPGKTLMVVDHNVPTSDRTKPNPDRESAAQIAYFAENAKLFGIEYYDEFDQRQGICHVVAPEQGFTLPGTVIVCPDSHTATHGAFGALAFGIGTTEAEHVLATQTLFQRKSKNMRAVIDGRLPPSVTAKDIILALIGEIGAAGGTGYAIEFAGEAICALSMEGRMTVCNMSIEAGARTGIIAPDEKTYAFLNDCPKSPKGKAWDDAVRYWDTLRSGDSAQFEREVRLDVTSLPPLVTWGTSPEQVVAITGRVPQPAEIADEKKRRAAERSLTYMGLKGGEKITDIALDRVFIGSCTNSRIEDLREAARVVDGRTVNANVAAMVVPGSGLVKAQAEAEGLAGIFLKAGFDWREPGCSMCLAMNGDKLSPGERCASTSTGISRVVKATRGAPISYRRRWQRPPRSPEGSSTCESGVRPHLSAQHASMWGERKAGAPPLRSSGAPCRVCASARSDLGKLLEQFGMTRGQVLFLLARVDQVPGRRRELTDLFVGAFRTLDVADERHIAFIQAREPGLEQPQAFLDMAIVRVLSQEPHGMSLSALLRRHLQALQRFADVLGLLEGLAALGQHLIVVAAILVGEQRRSDVAFDLRLFQRDEPAMGHGVLLELLDPRRISPERL